SEQVALVGSQPVTAPSETANVPGRTSESRVFDNVGSASSSNGNVAGFPLPKLLVKVKSCASFGTASFTTMMCPRLVFTNVQVTVSPGLTTIALTGLPSEQVALVRSQPLTAPSETANVPGRTWESRVLDKVGSASSSNANVAGFPLPKLLVKVKSCASFGTASLTTMMCPRLV